MKKGAVRSRGIARRIKHNSKRHIYLGTNKPLMISVVTLVFSLIIVILFSGYGNNSFVTGGLVGMPPIPAPVIAVGEAGLSQPGSYAGVKDLFVVNDMGQIGVYVNTAVPIMSYSFEISSPPEVLINSFNPEPYIQTTFEQIANGIRVSAVIPPEQTGLSGLVKVGTLNFNTPNIARRGIKVSMVNFIGSNSKGASNSFIVSAIEGSKFIYVFRGVFHEKYFNSDLNNDGCINDKDFSITKIKEMALSYPDLNAYIWDISSRWGAGCP